MQAAKKSLSTRAFQQVPRAMRRRAASHDVKRIPRRLRGRAGREVSLAGFRGAQERPNSPLPGVFTES